MIFCISRLWRFQNLPAVPIYLCVCILSVSSAPFKASQQGALNTAQSRGLPGSCSESGYILHVHLKSQSSTLSICILAEPLLWIIYDLGTAFQEPMIAFIHYRSLNQPRIMSTSQEENEGEDGATEQWSERLESSRRQQGSKSNKGLFISDGGPGPAH